MEGKIAVLFCALVVLFISGSVQAQKKYQTVGYLNTVWTSENLNEDHFSNGDPIKEAKTSQEWLDACSKGEPAWCFYDNNSENGKKYGRLYNWYAVNDPRGLAPAGWRIPTKADYEMLQKEITNDPNSLVASDNPKDKYIAGYTALMAGLRIISGVFYGQGKTTSFWTVTEEKDGAVKANVYSDKKTIELKPVSKAYGAYVRLVKNNR